MQIRLRKKSAKSFRFETDRKIYVMLTGADGTHYLRRVKRLDALKAPKTDVPPEPTLDSAAQREGKMAGELVNAVEAESPDVKVLCEQYHLKREELGRLTGFSLRALAEWSAGKLPSLPAKRRLHEVRRLLDALTEIVEPTEISPWLHRRNEAFDGLMPLQVIELGRIDRLWAMVHDLGSGQPT